MGSGIPVSQLFANLAVLLLDVIGCGQWELLAEVTLVQYDLVTQKVTIV